MTHCPPIYRKRKQEEKKKEVKKVERDKDKETLKKLVPKRFWRWGRYSGKRSWKEYQYKKPRTIL